MVNVVLVVIVPLVGEWGKGNEGGGGSEYLKTAQIFNQHALIKIWNFEVLPNFKQFDFSLTTPNADLYLTLTSQWHWQPGINMMNISICIKCYIKIETHLSIFAACNMCIY